MQPHAAPLRPSNHSLGRKLSLILLFVYQFLLFLLTWFLVGLAFVALRLALVTTMGESGDASLEWLSSFFRFLYVTVLVMEMVAAFVVDPRRVQRFHSTTVRPGQGAIVREVNLTHRSRAPARRASSWAPWAC